MKLLFSKDSNNEITVKLQNGTVIEDFTYIEMIRQLLIRNEFVDTDFDNLSETEINKINSMLGKITEVFVEEEIEEKQK
jgi:hypothetical protein